ncbi:unnamed protein product [Linum trigynum]|uniref:RNase H type-1 domain-containing protein n=1 Tax=Linum trigynum TaxID=586398 RepID=A0AAV2FZI7_9ROSI
MAECLAIRWGIDLAVEHGFGQCEIETDCLSVAQILRREEKVMIEEGVLCEDLRDHLSNMGLIQVGFSGRNNNKAAHLMAHTACGWEETEVWVARPPIFLVSHLLADFCNIFTT